MFDDSMSHIELSQVSHCKHIIELDVAIWTHHYALFLGAMAQDVRHCFACIYELFVTQIDLRCRCLYHFFINNKKGGLRFL